MPILENDIQIMASQVLDDVPEGGGAATGTAIADGVSNNLFPDVSELDRVYGRVQLRKVFPAVRTTDTDRYSGANVVVIDPPNDPDVSTVLFSTGDAFDTRDDAAGRIEAYLSVGAASRGLLFGNHIAGQMNVSLIQRVGTATPNVGETLVLMKNQGLVSEVTQYVRVTEVSSNDFTFEDQGGEFDRMVVTLGVSDQLLVDFPGFEAVRYDANITFTGKTRVFETIVADAARYYGVVPLATPITLGATTAEVDSIFSQLVPSTRAETPIADARMNQQLDAPVSQGGTVSFATPAIVLSPTQSLFVGGGVLPGTFTLVAPGAVTLTDSGGQILNGTTPVGTIDYASGVVALSITTAAGPHTVTYTPAGAPVLVTDSLDIPVLVTNQRLNYAQTISPAPAKRTLQVSYMARGRWYVLEEDGTGALRGADSSIGAGTINFTTGTVTVTLGALPDVGTSVIYTWAADTTATPVSLTELALGARFAQKIQLAGPIKPGTLTISWNDGTPRTATDSNGGLTGAATGKVFYTKGLIYFSPNALPAKGTVISVAITSSAPVLTDIASLTDGGTAWTTTLPTPIRASSVELSVVTSHAVRYYPGVDKDTLIIMRVFDDGAGVLMVAGLSGPLAVGTINYATGAVSLTKSNAGFQSTQGIWQPRTVAGDVRGAAYNGDEVRTLTLSIVNGTSVANLAVPAWAWWSGQQTQALKARAAGTDGATSTTTHPITQLYLEAKDDILEVPKPNVTSIAGPLFSAGSAGGGTGLGTTVRMYMTARGYLGVNFTMGGDKYNSKGSAGTFIVMRNASVLTGEGLEVGNLTPYGRQITLDLWPAAVSPLVTSINAVFVPPLTGPASLSVVDRVTFRTASAPIAPSGFNLVGTLSNDVDFNVIADEDGFVNQAGVVGRIDYDTGVARFVFGTPTVTPGVGVIDVSDLGVPGVTLVQLITARAESLRYNAVAFSYIPLSSDILGLNPVRLPPDGRVPIFRPGTVAVVHHTAETGPATVSNAQTINLGRIRISNVQVIGDNGVTITTGYTVNKNAGTVTFTNVTGYSQPVTIRHRIEDMALVADAQISGLLRFTRPMSHAYPSGSYVSSALLIGDMKARVSSLYDQATWTNVWSDDLIGSVASASYDQINYPPVVTNRSAVTERWILQFTGSTNFNIVGEHFGQVGAGNTSAGCAPLNPATGLPYFELSALGFGGGWAVGNVIRINTVGALAPVWVARVVQQGEPTVLSDSFTMTVRGDVDTP